ncbi:MAG TPA: GntR family transcriptional regulator [Herpetosiphonaceae bacterium]
MELNELMVDASSRYRSTPEVVAHVLRQAIMAGVFQDGQALRQDELAAELGLSKIPVREALRRLEAEGLVVFYPNRGAVVAALSAAEAEEIAEMRVALETLALRLALPRLTPRVLTQARAILDELDHEAEVTRWSTLNWEFHAALYAPAQRPRLLATITTLHSSVDRYMRVILVTMQHQAQSQQEHRALLSACEQHDETTACAILKGHITAASEMLAEHLTRKAEPQTPRRAGRKPAANQTEE